MEYCEGGYVNDLEYMQAHDISSNEVTLQSGGLGLKLTNFEQSRSVSNLHVRIIFCLFIQGFQ